ncbi:Glyoxylase, beta-lactamase superfamily II [Microlunatus sagamiharensis]|uniref:Glyoxylase, beta-lactamase superfamily II n=1 Tax=Microlunatus sagamiharensis TaxID=546874 RepID=A0A1H2NE57_9ACTN|nr:MBL fold metallo-hydrolase [Microlunatus sagamiharensis]SDV03712.1 Glyoxylase, beta-lactamase superfamily II [Microlunatus sagamiharensis]
MNTHQRVERLAPAVAGVLAPNPGPMTLGGTNTWVLGRPEPGPVLVVDPGPDDEEHLRRVLEVAGGRVSAVLVTHRHLDHVAGAARFAGLAGCGVRAVDPAWRVGEDGLPDGAVLEVSGARVEVLATPGHTDDSVSLLLTHQGEDGPAGQGEQVDLLTGDTVLGFGSTVITHPDGDLGAYLASLDRLLDVVATRAVARVLPGHGPVVADPRGVLEGYRRHRQERLAQVRGAVAAGASSPEDVVRAVYPEVLGTPLERAALQSARAQLDHLAAHREP